MKKLFVLVGFLALVFGGLPVSAAGSWLDTGTGGDVGAEPTFEILERGDNHMDIRMELPGLFIEEAAVDADGFLRVEIPRFGTLRTVGEPAIPMVGRWLAVPAGASVEVELLGRETMTHELDGQIVPVQPPRTRCGQDVRPFTIDSSAYEGTSFLPQSLVEMGSVGQMRKQGMARLELRPVQYNPSTGIIEVARLMDVRVSFAGQAAATRMREDVPAFERMYSKLLGYEAPEARGLPPVPESMLIVTSEAFVEEIMTLIHWKIRRGVQVYMTVLGDSADSDDVQSVIQQAYDDSEGELSYVLLVGDETNVPVVELSGGWYAGQSDYIYTLLEGGDKNPDVLIGRFSAKNYNQIAVQVAKTVRYEKEVGRTDPTDWITGMVGIGSSGSAGGPSDADRVESMSEVFAANGYDPISLFLEGQWTSR